MLNLVIKVLLYCCAIASLLTFLPGSILLDIQPKGFKVVSPKNLNAYTPIEAVNVAEYTEIPVAGPESIAIFNGRIVTASADGNLYEVLKNNQIKRILRVVDEPDCLKYAGYFTSRCGHPLGMKFDSRGSLFVVEPSRGIYRIDDVFGKSPNVTLILDIDETDAKFFDDVAVLEQPNGEHVLFITDVSRKFVFEQFMTTIFATDLGRVLRYDTATGKLDTLVDKLFFPNGIELTPSGDALFFAEFSSRAIHKFHLAGSRKGTHEKLLLNLPAEIDNLRLSLSGKTIWAAMLRPQSMFSPTEMDYYLKKPLLRKMITRASHLIGCALRKTGELTSNDYLKHTGFRIETLQWLIPSMIEVNGGMMLEIDFDGNTVSSIYSPNDTRLGLLSEVHEIPSEKAGQRSFYLGSYGASYLRKLVINN